jgi:hypothetical protein
MNMKILRTLLFSSVSISAVSACGGGAYRCKHRDGTVAGDSKATKAICDSLGVETCWCYRWAEDYCDPYGDNIQLFQQQCVERGDNWYWVECY